MPRIVLSLHLLIAALLLAVAAPGRRLVDLTQAARYLKRSERTVRNYIGEGRIVAYRVPGSPGVLVDLNDLDPSKLPVRSYAKFGPKARIIDLPAQAVVVEREQA